MANTAQSDGKALIAENRKARYEFFIEERIEAGVVLAGWEVKSLRAGRVQIAESYVVVSHGEVFLVGAHITPLISASTHVAANPTRQRKLLMNRSEIDRLVGAVERSGYTLVPLEFYWKAGRAKLRVGLAKGRDKARVLRAR
jgi:SsrA-binding protein